MGFKKLIATVVCIPIFACHSRYANAEIVTDGTLGTVVSLTGNDIEVTETLGARVGTNLFHSFESFDIQQGSTVTFTGSPEIENVLSRVTGGNPSVLEGRLVSEVGQANFYLINPAGLVFTENASVDVPASFHVGAASNIEFGDGVVFSSSSTDASTLSIADPTAFGFLGIEGDIELNGPRLDEFQSGSSVSLVASNITGTGDVFPFELQIVDGDLRIAATGSTPKSVDLTGDIVWDDFRGSIKLDNSLITVTGASRGLLHAGSISMFGNRATVLGEDGGSISVISSQLELSDNTSFQTVTFNSALDGGDIEVRSGSIEISGTAKISADTLSDARAGDVTVVADDTISIVGRSDGTGSTGIESDAASESDSAVVAQGNAGDIFVSANALVIHQGGHVRSQSFAAGNSGRVTVNADRIDINGAIPDLGAERLRPATGILSSNAGFGAAGTTQVNAREVSILETGTIGASDSSGVGIAGEVVVVVEERLYLDGVRSDSGFKTGIVSDSTNSEQSGGVVAVSAGNIDIVNGAQISAISASSEQPGRVSLEARDVLILDGGSVSSGAVGGGRGGEVTLTVEDTLQLSTSADAEQISSITTSAAGNSAGPITIDANVSIVRSSRVTTSTSSDIADGGDISISGGALVLQNGFVQANAESGSGGSIAIDTRSLVTASDKLSVNSANRAVFELGGGSAIQAVAPTGVSVEPEIAAPEVDISGALVALDSAPNTVQQIVNSPCAAFTEGAPSSLTALGKGGLPRSEELPTAEMFGVPSDNAEFEMPVRSVKAGMVVNCSNFSKW